MARIKRPSTPRSSQPTAPASQNYLVEKGKAPRPITAQEAYDYHNKGFMNKVAKYAPYAIMAGMGYGAASNYLGPSLGLAGGGGAAGATAPAAAATGGKLAGLTSGMSLLDWIMAGMAGKDLFGGGGGGGGQERATFEGESVGGVSTDPRDLLAGGVDDAEQWRNQMNARADRPVQLRSSYVQQPPTFTGGGMPNPIGLSGFDPALANPSLQTGEGKQGQGASEEALAAIQLLKNDQWKPGGR